MLRIHNCDCMCSKRKAQEEDDDASGDSSGDEFYDRTAGHGGAHALSQAAPAGKRQKPGEAVEAEDAASLFGKRVGSLAVTPLIETYSDADQS